MEKQIIQVPSGVRYISEWKEFNFDEFPKKCIINKQIPGCGMTEYILTGSFNAILSSPRLMLMWNKFNQHKKDSYIVINGMESELEVDKNINKDIKDISPISSKKSNILTEEEKKKKNSEIYEKLFNEISEYCTRMSEEGKYCKIIVTYDSYHIVQSILRTLGIYYSFKTFIDEFQSILHDARFKSSTEMGFLENLKTSSTAYFVSATPMLDDYIEMLDEFNSLPYYILDWDSLQPGRVVKPDLDVLTMNSVNTKASEIVQSYLSGKYKKATVITPKGEIKEIYSKEAVLFVNSVNHIISIIKRNKLTPDQVNILCSDTEYNKSRIRKKLGKKFTIGSVPLEGEPHKPFTFCTRTTYLGADFYSLCARTFIFSDSNLDCLAVDIAEDLPQILGRQRLTENPWKNQATFYYRVTADYKSMTAQDFKDRIDSKISKTNSLLKIFNSSDISCYDREVLANKYKEGIISQNYKNDYVAVNSIFNPENGKGELVPVINNLVLVNEIRAFRIQQIDYKDRFTVFSTTREIINPDSILKGAAASFLSEYYSKTTFGEKIKLLCEADLEKEVMTLVLNQIPDSDDIKAAYLILGPDQIRAKGYYNSFYIKKALGRAAFSKESLSVAIYSSFSVGEKNTLVEFKKRLSDLYSSLSYKKNAVASDLEEYFETKIVKVNIIDENGNKKRSRGYEILDYKRDSENFKLYQNYLGTQESLQELIRKENMNGGIYTEDDDTLG